MTDSLAHALERALAERDLALDYLERVLRMERSIEYRTAEEQATLRGARAVVADARRKVR